MAYRKVFRDYEEADVRETVGIVEPSGWLDLVNYLEKKGREAVQATPGADAHLIADAKQAAMDNVPYSHNPEQAYRVLKSHRNPGRVRQEEQKWVEWIGRHAESNPGGSSRAT